MIEQVLLQLIKTHPEAIADERTCRAFLEDLVPGEPARRNALWMAHVTGSVKQLRGLKCGKIEGKLLVKLAWDLESRTGLKRELAIWAVTVWSRALGLESDEAADGSGSQEQENSKLPGVPQWSQDNPFSGVMELPQEQEERHRLFFEQAIAECLSGTGMNSFREERLTDLQARLNIGREDAAAAFERVKLDLDAADASVVQLRELTVCPYGEGDFTSIAEAVRAEPAGARIWVRPGTYHESIQLEKTVELIAEGAREEVQILAENAGAIFISVRQVRVCGFTLTNKGMDLHPAVSVGDRQTLVEDCCITSRNGRGVWVSGPQVKPVFNLCTFTACARNGALVTDEAKPTFIDCLFLKNREPGIGIQTGANPQLRHCVFRENKDVGVFVTEQGRGEFVHCEFANHRLHGVQSQSGGNPLLRHCVFHNNGDAGMHACESGLGVLERCEFRGNGALGAVKFTTDGSSRVTVL